MFCCVLCGSAKHFQRAIVMPNLKPPVTTTARAIAYRDEILKALPPGSSFVPLMTLYLTDSTSPEEIKVASTDSPHRSLFFNCSFFCFLYFIVTSHDYQISISVSQLAKNQIYSQLYYLLVLMCICAMSLLPHC